MLEAVRDRARPYFEASPPAHDWHHVRRVEALAETLIDRHARPVDERIVLLAVLLHDIGRAREDRGEIDDHATWGAREAGGILRDLDGDRKTIERVQHCVRAHRYSNAVEPETLEAKLVCDADNLDALGAVGIARVFAHGAEIGNPIHDSARATAEHDADTGDGATQYDHFYRKILDLPARMYTDAGRDLATDRAAFVRSFLKRFDDKVTGDV
ncbi:HD domain-containing protein [Natrinema gelatinilyticum]|uniref:HD domain-containing protein n=1 Tax=Natrinema gelatinilyticum TaxID=2961571 RepID=UPI0020C2A714|nr:HD domain-containing protein [Natrinema gelatinilyticum]